MAGPTGAIEVLGDNALEIRVAGDAN
jgi:hypothetical protein